MFFIFEKTHSYFQNCSPVYDYIIVQYECGVHQKQKIGHVSKGLVTREALYHVVAIGVKSFELSIVVEISVTEHQRNPSHIKL